MQPASLILVLADPQRSWISATSSVPLLKHRLHLRRSWPSVNAVGKSLNASGPRSTITRCGPRNKAGVARQKGSWRQRSPRLGPATSLWPGSQYKTSTVNPRRRHAERRGSRPRTRRYFTVDPCRDQVSSRGGRDKLRTKSWFGLRGVGWRNRCSRNRSSNSNSNNKRKWCISTSSSQIFSSQGTGHYSQPPKPTENVARFARSSADAVRMRHSRRGLTSSGTATRRSCTH